MVPSNSAYEAASAKPQIVKTEASSDEPPPGGALPASAGGGAGGGGGGGAAGTPAAAPAKGNTVSATVSGPASGPVPAGTSDPRNQKPPTRAECTQVIDHFVDLEVQANPALQGIPPDMLAQLLKTAKGQASSQKGDPCAEEKITRGKYNCAMAASTREAWKACMK